QITTVGANVTTYNNTLLTADTKYYYRVKAYNTANGDSQYSNEDYAVTTVVTYTSAAWTYTYNGGDNGDDYVTSITAGPDNGPVATGYSYSTAGQFDYYTVKINRSTGGVTWGARYNGDQDDMDVARTIAADSNNDILVSGYSYLYGGGAGNTNDIYSIRYPSTGSPEDWADQYNGPGGDDDRSSVVDVTSDGNDDYVVVGYGKNASWNDDIYVIKYLNNGTRSWAATPYDGGSNDYPSAVAFDSSGNIFLTGYTKVGLYYNYFTRKYNGSTGAVIWTDVFNGAGTGDDFSRSLAVDSSGNVYVTGSSVTASGNEDFYTIKYNGATGARTWERSYNGAANGVDEAISVKVDPVNGQAVVAGTALTSSGNNDFHVIRYDTDGNVLWQRTVDRPSSNDFVAAAAMDRSGNIHIAGYTDGGSNTDVLSVWYNAEGVFSGGMTYNGAANGNDEASSITVNNMGEAFIGGHTINASGNSDYIVLKVSGYQLQPPVPLNAAPSYTTVDLTWSDNSSVEDGYYVERRVGACDSADPWALINTAAANAVSYSDMLLNTGSQYCYRVQAFRNNGESSVWTEKVTTTLSPSAPGGLSATAANTTQINLSWTDNTSAEDGFRIERCSGAGCGNFTELTTVAANTITYQDTSVCNATAYSYRVVAYKTGQWESAYSSTSSATTGTPSAPGSFAANRSSEVQINLSWTDTTSDETGFKVDRCTGAGCSDFAELTSVAAGTTTYNNAGLTSGMTYTYRVRAYKTATCAWETTSGTAAHDTDQSVMGGQHCKRDRL
ncbi:MAG: SBBP repeat-containing protein, partial [Geobacter sp.]|nr:SBBP repeat-containing protein [Geobacter sp.]